VHSEIKFVEKYTVLQTVLLVWTWVAYLKIKRQKKSVWNCASVL